MNCTCGAPLQPGSNFCGACGAAASGPQGSSQFCGHCGAAVDAGAMFCPDCGQAAGATQPQPAAPTGVTSAAPVASAARGHAPLNHANPGGDNPFVILFFWALVWALAALLFEIAETVSFEVFDHALLGYPPDPWKVKVVWIGIGAFGGTLAAIGSGVAARWRYAASGVPSLSIGFALIALSMTIQVLIAQVIVIETVEGAMRLFWLFLVIDACLTGGIGFIAALASSRRNAPVGFRALLAIPFWCFGAAFTTILHHPEIEEAIYLRVLGG